MSNRQNWRIKTNIIQNQRNQRNQQNQQNQVNPPAIPPRPITTTEPPALPPRPITTTEPPALPPRPRNRPYNPSDWVLWLDDENASEYANEFMRDNEFPDRKVYNIRHEPYTLTNDPYIPARNTNVTYDWYKKSGEIDGNVQLADADGDIVRAFRRRRSRVPPNRMNIKKMIYNDDNNFEIRRSKNPRLVTYFTGKNDKYKNIAKIFHKKKWKCRKSSPLEISRKHTMLTRYNGNNARIYIYPNIDHLFGTNLNDPYGKHMNDFFDSDDAFPFTFEFDLDKKIFVICARNLLMLDWDYKDLDLENPTEYIIGMIQEVANELSKFLDGEEVVFTCNLTDRGIHAFLLSHPMDFRNQNILDFMSQICTDAWYVAFTPLRGWCVRLSPKAETFDDFIAQPFFEKEDVNTYELFSSIIPEKISYEFIVSNTGYKRSAHTNWPEIYSIYLLLNSFISFFKSFDKRQYNMLIDNMLSFNSDNLDNLRRVCYHLYDACKQQSTNGNMTNHRMDMIKDFGNQKANEFIKNLETQESDY